jgi:hydrogenase expression/formation protein HypD
MIKYIDDFRIPSASQAITKRIRSIHLERDVSIMEVCGGHTHSIHKYGISDMLPANIRLISGPGCPVCVTAQSYVDTAIELSRIDNITIMTFGDMIRVPGSVSSLLAERAKGRDVRICLSAQDAMLFAESHPGQKVVFLGIGFETTAPSIAASILAAYEKKLANYSVLCGLKTMPAALTALVSAKEVAIHGFICPGHVSAITGLSIYEPLANKFGIPCVVSGFEPNDLLLAIEMLIKQMSESRAEVENEYTRVVKTDGNPRARKILDTVFAASTESWRVQGSRCVRHIRGDAPESERAGRLHLRKSDDRPELSSRLRAVR